MTSALLVLATPALAFDDATYKGRFAPEFYKAGQLRTLAILPFTGPDAAEFTNALSAELGKQTLNGENWFTIKPATTKEDNPASAGKALGVAGIVSGNVVSAKLTRTDRIEPAKKGGKSGATDAGTPCTRIVLQYTVRAQVHDVANGATVYDKTQSAQDGYDVCNGKGQAIPDETDPGLFVKAAKALTGGPKKDAFAVDYSEDALFQRVRGVVAGRIRADITPYNKDVSFELKREARELPKPMQLTFESANPFVKAGEINRACSIWQGLANEPAAATSVSLLYNLGACEEYLTPENPIAALEIYAKANQLVSKPDKLLTPALKRAREMVDNQQKIGS